MDWKNWLENQNKDCIEKTNVSHILFKEKGKSITFTNPDRNQCYKLQVDGCLIKKDLRCDNILIDPWNNSGFYIELKGGDISKAIEQLKRTVCTFVLSGLKKKTAMLVCKNHYPSTNYKLMSAKKYFDHKKGVSFMLLNSSVDYNLKTNTYKDGL